MSKAQIVKEYGTWISFIETEFFFIYFLNHVLLVLLLAPLQDTGATS
jgi:hypothetical protein